MFKPSALLGEVQLAIRYDCYYSKLKKVRSIRIRYDWESCKECVFAQRALILTFDCYYIVALIYCKMLLGLSCKKLSYIIILRSNKTSVFRLERT